MCRSKFWKGSYLWWNCLSRHNRKLLDSFQCSLFGRNIKIFHNFSNYRFVAVCKFPIKECFFISNCCTCKCWMNGDYVGLVVLNAGFTSLSCNSIIKSETNEWAKGMQLIFADSSRRIRFLRNFSFPGVSGKLASPPTSEDPTITPIKTRLSTDFPRCRRRPGPPGF